MSDAFKNEFEETLQTEAVSDGLHCDCQKDVCCEGCCCDDCDSTWLEDDYPECRYGVGKTVAAIVASVLAVASVVAGFVFYKRRCK